MATDKHVDDQCRAWQADLPILLDDHEQEVAIAAYRAGYAAAKRELESQVADCVRRSLAGVRVCYD